MVNEVRAVPVEFRRQHAQVAVELTHAEVLLAADPYLAFDVRGAAVAHRRAAEPELVDPCKHVRQLEAEDLREVDRVLRHVNAVHLFVVAGVDEGVGIVDGYRRNARDDRVIRDALVIADVAIFRIDERLRDAVDRDRGQQIVEGEVGEQCLVMCLVCRGLRAVNKAFHVRRVAAQDVHDVADAPAVDEYAVHGDVDLLHRRRLVGHVVDMEAEFLRCPDREARPHVAVSAVEEFRSQCEQAVAVHVHALYRDAVVERDRAGERRRRADRVGLEHADRRDRGAAGIHRTIGRHLHRSETAVVEAPRRDVQVLAVVAHDVELVDVLLLGVGAGEIARRRRCRSRFRAAGRRQHVARRQADRGQRRLDRRFELRRCRHRFQKTRDGFLGAR